MQDDPKVRLPKTGEPLVVFHDGVPAKAFDSALDVSWCLARGWRVNIKCGTGHPEESDWYGGDSVRENQRCTVTNDSRTWQAEVIVTVGRRLSAEGKIENGPARVKKMA